MNHDTITRALRLIAPNTEWSLAGDTYEDLQWLDTSATKPTKKAIQDAIGTLSEIEAQKAAKQLSAKQAILDRLGLTDEEAKLLLS